MNHNLPLLTAELADLIEKSDCDVMRGRMEYIGKQQGNPYGVEIKTFGRAVAMLAHHFPVIDFNRVYGIGAEEIQHVDDICAFFASANRNFMIDVPPQRTTPELLQALTARGFRQSGFHTAMYGVPDVSKVRPVEGLEVRRVQPHEVELYGRIFTRSLEIPDDIPERTESNFLLVEDPEWHLYLCWQGDTAIGFTMMQIVDGVAGFALAATLPEYRNRGAQTAMLHQRMLDAEAAGAHLIVAQCDFASGSHRNLQRAGFHVAYTKAVWKREEA
ncbi:GNAT family N-acetyltransferase [Tumebacillus flagellatus]|uniref:N-acetyltransferase domain-containing protein n=1 Tax=Tumebacillus flagellatus TaxID=1157490 RepID=A0A074LRS3_9BACL|nr:GNAT family N-acetyltransferase [Tumebacillus flagellatus]KEO84851.1 hypothetical protein EL26_02250 [Tumebacillus flagellatus]